MNAQNTTNVFLQDVRAVILEKINSLTNQIGDTGAESAELMEYVDCLIARIGELESSVVEAKKEPAIKPQQGFGDKFNKKECEWDCQTCYLRNKPSEDICVSCGMGKGGKEAAATTSSAFKPTTFSSRGKTEPSTTESKRAETKSLFGATKQLSSAKPGTSKTVSKPAPPKPLPTTDEIIEKILQLEIQLKTTTDAREIKELQRKLEREKAKARLCIRCDAHKEIQKKIHLG